jgi:hypothetical protein
MKIGCIIPATSKNRPWTSVEESYLYTTTLKSFMITYSNKHKYIFYIGIDTNDPIYDNTENKEKLIKFCKTMKNIDIEFIYMDGITKGHLTVMWNRLFEKAYKDDCDYFFQCGDDIEFKTKKWVNECIDTLQKSNNIGVVGPINNNANILTQSFVSRKHMDLFGYYFPPEIINWYCDDWINNVYRGINRFYPLIHHLCINVGGTPRYDINNETYNSNENFNQKCNEINQLCNSIVLRDLERIDYKKYKSKPSSFCSICTSNCAFELVGLLLSLSVFHPNEKMFILCDTKTKYIIDNMTPQPRLNITWFIELDKYDGMNRQIMTEKGIWSDFQMAKANVIEYALKEATDTLFLDSDIILTDIIDNIDMSKELGVSPQFITQEHVDKTGYYNGGMLWTKNKNVPKDWIKFTKTSRYFDQASIEDLAKKYAYFEFGENYNLQSWRLFLSSDPPQQIANYISSKSNDKLYYKLLPLKFVHTHFLEKRFEQFNDLIIHHLSNAKMYKILAIVYRVINNNWVLKIPKQPIQGLGRHNNDSYRELPLLMKLQNKDVDIKFDEKTIHCWIEPNILTYDRPTLEWCNQEIATSSLMLLGNGDVKVEGQHLKYKMSKLNIKPWIFWPRKPMLLEKVLKMKGILNYNERENESIFIGNFENSVQEKFRKTTDSWDSVLTEYHCTKGQQHKFSHEEYLLKLRGSRYGLCLRGYGSKCHREVELMAFGTVPIVTPEVTVSSYMEPLIENTHYILVKSPEELNKKITNIDEEQWTKMSSACYEWYQRNVHSKNCWKNMIEHILYE